VEDRSHGVGNYEYREDGKGRLSQVLNPFGQLSTREYDLTGSPVLTLLPNGTQEERSYTATRG
jgi:hypothetical protein